MGCPATGAWPRWQAPPRSARHGETHLAFEVGDPIAEVDELVAGLLALGPANARGGQLSQGRAHCGVGAAQSVHDALKISDCVSMIPMIEPQASAKQHERSERGDNELRDLLQGLVGDTLPGGDCRFIAHQRAHPREKNCIIGLASR
jgi:hypothetical protein